MREAVVVSYARTGLAKSAQAGELWAQAQAEFVSKFGGESAAEAAREAFHRMGQMG